MAGSETVSSWIILGCDAMPPGRTYQHFGKILPPTYWW